MNLTRRDFVKQAAVMTASGLGVQRALGAEVSGTGTGKQVIVSTWPFGKPANEKALEVLRSGGSNLDAVEQGIRLTEKDSGNQSVGLGGRPNAAGFAQLDACIMNGPGHQAGAVAGVEDIVHPISAARLVMEKTPHVMLVGEGARLFAIEHGVESVPVNSEAKLEEWKRERKKAAEASSSTEEDHDTIALLILGADGNLAGGCSTSGLANKLPGRVGDSPIIGSGLYVDNEVGAAGATGVGENVMRYCGTFMVVENMRHGMSPVEACEAAVRRIASMDPKGMNLRIHFIALNKKGEFGAAGSEPGFRYAVTTPEFSELKAGKALGGDGGAVEGGNRP